MRDTPFRKPWKLSSCTPLALANNRQLNNSTVVIPTDRNMDSSLSVELIRDCKSVSDRQGANSPITSTDDDSSTAVFGKIAVSAQQSARKPAPATVLPNSRVATPNNGSSKISSVQDTLCTRITGRWYRSPSSVL